MLSFFRKIRQSLLSENSFSRYLLYALGEIILVVIGILLALQINNWNEVKKIEENKRKTLALIKKELLSNQKSVDNVFEYHIMVRDTLQKLKIPETEDEVKAQMSFWRGLRIFRLRDAAFQTAVQAGTTKDLNVDLVEELNALYTSQEAYNNFGATASSTLYQKDFSDIKNFKKLAIFLNMVMVDLYYFESELKADFETCLKKIDSISE
ncbi:MAG: hypothetical protein ED555_02900 [Allomuricauda sp.]|nr:MAG: hypothetical protein ED555_02900 [Allomuricauda sp.]